MKVFTAIYKRIYRALNEEFCKLFKLNATYLDPQTYSAVVNEQIGPDDFDEKTYRVVPAADPNATSASEKLQKAQGLLELLPIGVLDPIQVITRVLKAQDQPNYQQLFNQQVQQTGQMPPPPPDPKVQELQMKSQAQQQEIQLKAQAQQQSMQLDQQSAQAKMENDKAVAAQKMQIAAQEANLNAAVELHTTRAKMAQDQMANHQQIQQSAETHQETIRQSEESHKAKVQQTKEMAKSAQPNRSQTGKTKR